jgi:hypothetical protein
MKHWMMMALFLGVTTMAHAEVKTACGMLTQQDAEQLVGGPLGNAVASKAEPGSSDPKTSCGFFPKGYSFESAEGPPEMGIEVTVHTAKNAESAKRFYEASLSMSNQAKSDPGSPFSKDKITKLKEIGDVAFLVDRISFKTALIFVVKGSTLMQVQVWKKAGATDQVATNAAKQLVDKL